MKKEELNLVTVEKQEYDRLIKLSQCHEGITSLIIPEWNQQGLCHYLLNVAVRISDDEFAASTIPITDLVKGLLEFSRIQSEEIKELNDRRYKIEQEISKVREMNSFSFKVYKHQKRYNQE